MQTHNTQRTVNLLFLYNAVPAIVMAACGYVLAGVLYFAVASIAEIILAAGYLKDSLYPLAWFMTAAVIYAAGFGYAIADVAVDIEPPTAAIIFALGSVLIFMVPLVYFGINKRKYSFWQWVLDS